MIVVVITRLSPSGAVAGNLLTAAVDDTTTDTATRQQQNDTEKKNTQKPKKICSASTAKTDLRDKPTPTHFAGPGSCTNPRAWHYLPGCMEGTLLHRSVGWSPDLNYQTACSSACVQVSSFLFAALRYGNANSVHSLCQEALPEGWVSDPTQSPLASPPKKKSPPPLTIPFAAWIGAELRNPAWIRAHHSHYHSIRLLI
jgi:hypothetical protein